MKNLLLAAACLLSLNGLYAQYPKSDFIAPLDTPLTIVGTFGEIRPDHFHTGIDLGTGEQEGVPVMAAADGYVSRIKIAADGYGKALYITHPNGFVTVYGHLSKFNSSLNDFVRKKQYEKQSFEIDETLKPKDFKIKQREIIAYSGSSGGAEGPHLHFEIRDEQTEEPINPMLFGITSGDHIPPKINFIRIYPFQENGIVNKTDTAQTFEVVQVEGINMLNIPDFVQAYGTIMFGISASDLGDNSAAELGIYSAELYVDQNLAYSWRYDRLNFDDLRFVNAHTDYMTTLRDKVKMERAFRLPGNHLNLLYPDTGITGYQFFTEDVSHDMRFVVKDFAGNSSFLDFQVITYSTLMKNPYMPHPEDALLVTPMKGIAVHKPRLDVVIPSGAAYQDFYYTDKEAKNDTFPSNIFKVGNFYEAIHSSVTIGIKPNQDIPDSLRSKVVIAQIPLYGPLRSWGGSWSGKFLSAKVKNYGDFVMAYDTLPPSIEKEYVPADMNTAFGPVVKVKIKDNLSGIKSYSVRVDNKWWLFEYDKKNNQLIGDISSVDMNHEHPIEVTTTDQCGNTNTWKSSFWW